MKTYKVTEALSDFIKSDETYMDLSKIDKRYKGRIVKMESEGDIENLFFYAQESDLDEILSSKVIYFATANKITGEIYMCNNISDSYYDALYIRNDIYNFTIKNEELKKNKDKLDDEISKKSYDIILKKLQTLDEIILSKISLKDYEDKARSVLMRKQDDRYQKPSFKIYLSPKLYKRYFEETDYDKFLTENISDDILKKYEDFVGVNKNIEIMKNQLSKDPLGERKAALISLIDDPNYKTLNVYYHLPNGSQLNEKINKERKYNDNIKKSILELNEMSNIPICLIDEIRWGKRVLYNDKDYQDLELDKDTILANFAKAGNVDKLDKDDYKNKNLMKQVLAFDPVYVTYLDISLQSDKNYINEIINDICKCKKSNFNYVTNLLLGLKDKSLINDKDFLLNVIEREYTNKELNYSNKNGLDRLMLEYAPSIFSDKDSIIRIAKVYSLSNMFFNSIDETLYEDKDFLIELDKAQSQFKYYSNDFIISNMTNTKVMRETFESSVLASKMYAFKDEIYDNNNFIYELLFENKYKSVFNESMIKKFQYDDDMMELILPNIKDIRCAQIYNKIKNPKNDDALLYKFLEENTVFIGLLRPEQIEELLDDEFYDYEEVSVYPLNEYNYSLSIKTPNYLLEYNGFSSAINFVNPHNPGEIVNRVYGSSRINKLEKLLNKKFPQFKKEKIKKKVVHIIDLQREKAVEEER